MTFELLGHAHTARTEDAGKDVAALPERRRSLAAHANLVRARLIEGMDALLERKRRLLNPAEVVRRHGTATIVIGASAALALAMGVALAVSRNAARKKRTRQARGEGWMSLVRRPESVIPKPRSWVVGLLKKGTSAAFAATIAVLAKHYVAQALTDPGERPVRRLPPKRDPHSSHASVI
jgi:hypothetical protein